ncbi:hypothetical protein UA08_02696 [Talaromyces atroroseus]|uniref:Uncharacterized protein n=1 Tax=Talaromyces atroroseus TaxID=1441469 RepID=A0A225B933_TALAT|nr:hypothetical protein UA08_02696 [Talaromyces atroroseus]OKL62467.1 hypothetical protein UA08_02696 [Talaromyces atroroseus]
MAWADNLEADVKLQPSSPRPRHVLLLLVLASILGTIVFYLALGVLLLCYSSDASPLLAVITTSSRLNDQWSYWSPFYAVSKSSIALFEKPKGLNVVAVVSYRSLERTSVLDCYLQRNLVENGGLLDEVVFIPETAEPMHLEWLDETVNKSDSYSIQPSWQELPFLNNDGESNKSHHLYVKIDGDVVYIEDNVIPTIVNTKLQHPKMTLVSANVIHQPAVAKFHRRPGVVVPQLFDFDSWTASTSYEQDNQREPTLLYWKNVLTMQWQGWLRRAGRLPGSADAFSTPAASASLLGDTERYAWVAQAQQHNSFLHHLERGDMDLQRYKFPLWINPPEEVSGAFVCATRADMTALMTTSEKDGSNLSTQLLKKHTIIDGKGVVSHYDGIAGLDGLDSTNVLGRYRSYAEENVCPKRDS